MDNLADLLPIAIIAVVLVVAWVLFRVAFKLTTTLFRIGCFIIVLLVLGGIALTFLGQ
ncbi:MAG: hypothetical protein WAM60_10610 [Candidatus Promineifilaceae bacterium]